MHQVLSAFYILIRLSALRAHMHICLSLSFFTPFLWEACVCVCETLGVAGNPLICLCGLILCDSRSTEHSLADSVQRSYALEPAFAAVLHRQMCIRFFVAFVVVVDLL